MNEIAEKHRKSSEKLNTSLLKSDNTEEFIKKYTSVN